jgi:hypothetical protein
MTCHRSEPSWREPVNVSREVPLGCSALGVGLRFLAPPREHSLEVTGASRPAAPATAEVGDAPRLKRLHPVDALVKSLSPFARLRASA